MANSPLNFDNSGFLVGLQQIENQTQSVHQDTQEIIRILRSELNQSQNHLRRIRDNTRNTNRQLSQSNSGGGQGASDNANAQPPIGSGRVSPTSRRRDFGGRSGGGTASPRNRITQHANNAQERAERRAANNGANRNPSNRNRDERGRFTANQENNQENNNLAESIGEAVGENMQGVVIDDKNLDPLIDSFNEVKDVLSPLTSLFGWLTGGKNKPSRYERRRDRETQESLDDIEDALNNNSNTGAGGGGLLSGLLGGRGGLLGGLLGGALGAGGRLLKFGGKRLPLIGALLGAGSLAMNWDNLDTKDKGGGVGGVAGGLGGALAGASAGAMAGSVVPVVGTVIGGVVGGLAGGWFGHDAGQALGETAAPYISRWTSNLNQANLPKKMESIYTKGLKPFFLGATGIWDWVKTKALGLLGMGSGEGGGDGESSSLWGSTKDMVGGWFGVDGDAKSLQSQLKASGLVGESAINGGLAHAGTYAAALNMRQLLGDNVKGFGAFDDKFHKSRGGYHPKGLAFDMSVKGGRMGKATPEVAQIRQHMASMGFVEGRDFGMLDEYLKPSKGATGGHVHFNWKSQEAANRYMQLQKGKSGDSGKAINGGKAGVNSSRYDSLIAKSAAKNGVDPALMKAMMHTESGFNPNARSPVGAQGLMQLMPATARRFGVVNPNDPAQNIEGAARYLAYLNKKFKGDQTKVIAAYNAGEGNVAKYGGIPPFKETRDYVSKVKGRYGQYKGVQPSASRLTPLANSPISSVTRPTPLPPLKAPPLPQPPKVTKSVSTTQKPLMLSSNNQSTIPQNVSDRGIAHAVTGGLGEDRWYG